MRNDNVAYFVTTSGTPLDTVALEMDAVNKLLRNLPLDLGEPYVIKVSNKYHILLPVASGVAVSISRAKDNIELTLGKLQKILVKKGIESFSISKSENICELTWVEILSILKKSFDTKPEIIIVVCLGLIRVPTVTEREQILQEAHCSAVGGHKGITKTWKRIKKYSTSFSGKV